MKTFAIPLIIGVIVIGAVGALVMSQYSDSDSDSEVVQPVTTATETDTASTPTTPAVPTTPSTPTPSPSSTSYSLADVGTHSGASNCWSIVNGNVYDLTAWVPKHPGGENAILGICGKDGSAKFNGKHGGSALQEGILAGYKIGTLLK